jgi:membrane dipeptidase
MIVDAHLDLAHNALDLKRDLTLELSELRKRAPQGSTPMVTLPALRQGGIGLVFATIWVDPRRYSGQAAQAAARAQLELYERWEEAGWVRILREAQDLSHHRSAWPQDRRLGLLLLIEGADPLADPQEVALWRARGVRLLGPAWRATRYAGGTGEPGPLTPLGQELLAAMQEAGIALDVSHLAEEAFWQALEVFSGPVCATHANPRTLLPTDRHLSDVMLKALKARQGVVGTVLYNAFLQTGWQAQGPRVPLARVQEHLDYLASLLGWEGVGIGSDWDGGFGLEGVPQGLESPADLARLGELVPSFARAGVLGANWIRWLEGAL